LKSPIRIAAAYAVILLAGEFGPTADLPLGALRAKATEEVSFQQTASPEITNSTGRAARAGLSPAAVRDMRVREFLQWKDLRAPRTMTIFSSN
jgi:hypothetical protein